ncbi:hypothetical protein P7C71_g4991, partial [Lecanoromycetidae sp. Uapishka_2]
MPSSYTAAQKASIAQFVSFTSVKDSVAAKHLKAQGWNVEQAVDAFALRRPLMPEFRVQLWLRELGFGQEFDFRLNPSKESRNYDHRPRLGLLGVDQSEDRGHVSTRYEYLNPKGYRSMANWNRYLSDVPEDDEQTHRRQDWIQFKQDTLNKSNFENPSEYTEAKVDCKKFDEVINDLADLVKLYRSGKSELSKVVVMIKDQLEGASNLDEELIAEIVSNDERNPVQAAETIFNDADFPPSDDEEDNEEQDSMDDPIPSIESTDVLPDSPLKDRSSFQPIRAMEGEMTVMMESHNIAENEVSEGLGISLASTQSSPLVMPLANSQAADAGLTSSHRKSEKEGEPQIESLISEALSPKRDRSPLATRTNQNQSALSPREGRTGTPVSISSLHFQGISPRDPVIFRKTMWDGGVSDKGKCRSPEDGWTDDLYGLPMSSKEARSVAAKKSEEIERSQELSCSVQKWTPQEDSDHDMVI